MKNIKRLLTVILVIGIVITKVSAQARTIPEIHSMMMYNFMKYVHWPPTATSGDFVIGVIGEPDVYATLTQWYGTKTKGAQKIVIKQFKSVEDLSDCHVLYIGKSKSGDLEDVLAKISGKPTLVITNKAGLAKKGSGINFKTVNGKLKIELNQEAVASANLKVSSQLTGMAIII